MMHISEKIKNVSSAINSIILSIGIVVGGFWAFHKFQLLDEVDKSKFQIIKLDLESKLHQRDLDEFPAISVSIEATQIDDTSISGYPVSVRYLFENLGSRSERIEFESDSFGITRIHVAEDGSISFGADKTFGMPSGDKPEIPLGGLLLRAKDRDNLTSVVVVAEPGIYLVRFYANQSAKNQKRMIEKWGKPKNPNFRGFRWAGSGIIIVKSQGES